jgi:oxygen-dependent protoporphyrinogen oxidase
MLRLIHDAGLDHEVDSSTFLLGIVRDGRIHRFPQGRNLKALFSPFLSPSAKLQLVKLGVDIVRASRALARHDLTRLAAIDDETAAEYAHRRLNQECLDYLVELSTEGWFYDPPEESSKAALLWHLKNFFLGRLINSRRGVGFLVDGLAERVPVMLRSEVSLVEDRPDGVSVSWRDESGERVETASAAIIATPADVLPKIYPGLDQVRREIVDEFDYPVSTDVTLGLRSVPAEPSLYVLVSRREHPGLQVILLDHHKPGRAPEGRGLVTLIFRSTWQQRLSTLDDDAVVEVGITALNEVVPGMGDLAYWSRVERPTPCILRARPGVFARAARFEAATDPHARVQLAGDYLPISSTNACLVSGERAAARVARRSVPGSRPTAERRPTHRTMIPPSTGSVTPVTYRPLGPTRYSRAAVTSAGSISETSSTGLSDA